MKLSSSEVPLESLKQLRVLLDEFMRSNPLNSSTVTGTMRLAGSGSVEAGQTRVSSAGLWMPFDGQSTSVAALARTMQGDTAAALAAAQGARARAESAYDRAGGAWDAAYNAQQRADSAYERAGGAWDAGYQAQRRADAAYDRAGGAWDAAYNAQRRADSAYSLADDGASQSQITALYNMTARLINEYNAHMDKYHAGGDKPPLPPRPPKG